MCLYAHTGSCSCAKGLFVWHRTYGKVRGPLLRVGSPFYHVEPRAELRSSDLVVSTFPCWPNSPTHRQIFLFALKRIPHGSFGQLFLCIFIRPIRFLLLQSLGKDTRKGMDILTCIREVILDPSKWHMLKNNILSSFAVFKMQSHPWLDSLPPIT